MTSSDNNRPGEVEQCDRNAASLLYEWFPVLSSSPDAAQKTAQFIRDGGGDGWSTVRLFADHRRAAITQQEKTDVE